MGITIHFRGGAIPQKTVDHIISQLEQKYKREGYEDRTQDPADCDRCYFKLDAPLDDRQKLSIKSKTISKEREDMEMWFESYRRDIGEAAAQKLRERFENRVKRDVVIPDDFEPTRQKGICLNPDPHSETFCIKFVQDNGKDSWRMPDECCKTQFVPQEGVHIELCEYLRDIQKKMQDAGGDLLITDEAEYCDDEKPQGDRQTLIQNTEENRKIIAKVGGMLAEAGWGVETKQNVVQQVPDVPEGVPTGTLEDWMAMRRADLLVTVMPKNKREQMLMELWIRKGVKK